MKMGSPGDRLEQNHDGEEREMFSKKGDWW